MKAMILLPVLTLRLPLSQGWGKGSKPLPRRISIIVSVVIAALWAELGSALAGQCWAVQDSAGKWATVLGSDRQFWAAHWTVQGSDG